MSAPTNRASLPAPGGTPALGEEKVFPPSRRTILFILLWQGLIDVVLTLRAISMGHPPKLSHIDGEILGYIAICLLGLIVHAAVRGSRGLARPLRVVAIGAGCLTCGLIQEPLVGQIMRATTDHVLPPLSFYLSRGGGWVWLGSVSYIGMAVGFVGLDLQQRLKLREQQLARSEELALETRLLALRLQIDPHFLFNSLTAVQALVLHADVRGAEQMLDRLSAFLRSVGRREPLAQTTLAEEFDTVEGYLDIEAVRFPERMQVRYECPPQLHEALVPGFILQPLAENAVRHGVAASRAPVVLTIAAEAAGGELVLRVENSLDAQGLASDHRGMGLGLENVRERLMAAYGERAGVTLQPGSEAFTAEIRLPLAFAEPPVRG